MTVGEGRKSATLGRAEDNDVVVKGNLISRVHARIEASRDKFTLVDESYRAIAPKKLVAKLR